MNKSPDAFRTISEVADQLETPAHVLRFWESRFPQIRPVKRAGGRRYYRPSDIALLSGIKRLLHDEGMTIRGVQKILREQGVRHVAGLAPEGGPEVEGVEVSAALSTAVSEAVSDALAEILAESLAAGDEDGEVDAAPVALAPAPATPEPAPEPAPVAAAESNVLPLRPPRPAAPAPAAEDARQPDLWSYAPEGKPAAGAPEPGPRPRIAALLRGMDAARAKKHRDELVALHRYLTSLRDRMRSGARHIRR